MLRVTRLLTIALLISAPACRRDDGLGRVEVRGKVTYQGAPVERGLITFRPAGAAKGPAAGTSIVNGSFKIPSEKGPVAGTQKVEIKIVEADNDSSSAAESAMTKRKSAKLKTFSQQVELTKGVNPLEFSFPSKPPVPEKTGLHVEK